VERFIIGTGRCGSTLLTNMLGQHPDLLVLSEFFVTMDRKNVFSPEPISGKEFAEFIDREHFVVPPIRRRFIESKENLGDVPESERVPALMVSTIPMNSDQPLELYAELQEAVSAFLTQPRKQHFADLTDWLMRKTGKTEWLERSGPSAEYVPELVQQYPNAKYVHLHRNGPDNALSMMRNPYFQLVVSFFYNPPTREDLLATEYGGQRITRTDTLSRRLSTDFLPPERFAEYWSYELTLTYKALAQLNKDQYIDVRFEDLIAEPEATLVRIADFFELPQRDGWVAEAASLITGLPDSGFDQLPEDVQNAIRRECATGELLLGRRTSPWIFSTLELIEELAWKRFGRPG
jgi:hypothetical protein